MWKDDVKGTTRPQSLFKDAQLECLSVYNVGFVRHSVWVCRYTMLSVCLSVVRGSGVLVYAWEFV